MPPVPPIRPLRRPSLLLRIGVAVSLVSLYFPPLASAEQPGRGDRLVGEPFAIRAPTVAQHGMAATSQPLASQVAIDILKRGGSAIDAAIAANAMLGLVEPTGAGIGGDLFAIVWDPKTKELYGYNGSGRSPMGLSLDMVKAGAVHGALPPYGPLSVSVPGAVDGWFALHDKFGRLPMADLLAPAIGYAQDGFPLTKTIAASWAANINNFIKNKDQIPALDNALATYTIDGHPPATGEVFRNPDLAATYKLIATGGRDAFYKGPIADRIDAFMHKIGGKLAKADLAAHHGEWVKPVSTSYRGYSVYQLPPNSQGMSVLQMLNILEGYDLAKMGRGTADTLHVMIEAKKLAYADRARYFADPDFAKTPIKSLLDKGYADARRSLIRMDKAMEMPDPGAPPNQGDTVYFTVADKDGMMVSWIQSNYRGMGSGLVADHLGFMFQDRGQLFTLKDGHPNAYAPGKRPFHTIIPGFVTKDGEPFLSFGVMGGAVQPQGQVQVLTNIIDFGLDVQAAGDAARFVHEGRNEPDERDDHNPVEVQFESGVMQAALADLIKRGHNASIGRNFYGGYEAILWDAKNRVYHGATEMRFDGLAIGY